MDPLQKRAIAKLAYKEIKSVIDKWESLGEYNYLPLCCHWDGCITVDDTLFHEYQLREYEGDE